MKKYLKLEYIRYALLALLLIFIIILCQGDRISNADSVEEETIYQENDSGKYPYVVSWTNPKVTGVLVIAEGGGNTKVKAEILEAVQALFGIEPHKIKIMKMGEGGNIVEKN